MRRTEDKKLMSVSELCHQSDIASQQSGKTKEILASAQQPVTKISTVNKHNCSSESTTDEKVPEIVVNSLCFNNVPFFDKPGDIRPYIKHRLNGVETESLVDTGAMTCVLGVTNLSELDKYNTVLEKSRYTVTTLHKRSQKVEGQMTLKFTFGNRSERLTVIVVKTFYPQFIVGMTFCRAFGIKLVMDENAAVKNTPTDIQTIYSPIIHPRDEFIHEKATPTHDNAWEGELRQLTDVVERIGSVNPLPQTIDTHEISTESRIGSLQVEMNHTTLDVNTDVEVIEREKRQWRQSTPNGKRRRDKFKSDTQAENRAMRSTPELVIDVFKEKTDTSAHRRLWESLKAIRNKYYRPNLRYEFSRYVAKDVERQNAFISAKRGRNVYELTDENTKLVGSYHANDLLAAPTM